MSIPASVNLSELTNNDGLAPHGSLLFGFYHHFYDRYFLWSSSTFLTVFSKWISI